MKSKLIYKLLAVFLLCSLLTIAVVGFLSYRIGKELLQEKSFMQLAALKASKAQQVESYFETIRSQTITLAENRMTVEAMRDLKLAFSEGDLFWDAYSAQAQQRNAALRDYYQHEFYNRLTASNDDVVFNIENYLPRSTTVAYWQHLYIAQNPYPDGQKLELLNAGDRSAYSNLHATFHPNLKSFLKKSGYYDILLVDDKTGHIVYSVSKEVHYGTSLLTGPYSNTNLAAVFQDVLDETSKNAVVIKDFALFAPSYYAPASFIAAPIFDGNNRIGVLIIQIPITKINAVLTSNGKWKQTGMGDTGETYLVGTDNKMRSNSRFLMENPEGYLQSLEQAGYLGEDLQHIRTKKTTILYQPIYTESIEEAKKGNTGIGIIKNYRNAEVLSSYIPLSIEGIEWYLLSEIETAEAFAPIAKLFNRILQSGLAVLFVVACISVFFARSFVRPITQLKEAAHNVAQGDQDVYIPVKSSDEIGQLSASFNVMVTSIRESAQHVAHEQAQTKIALDEAQAAKLSAELALQQAEAAKDDAMHAKGQAEASRAQVEAALQDAEQAKADALASKEKAEASAREARLEKEKANASAEEARLEKEKANASAEDARVEKEKANAAEQAAARAMKDAIKSKNKAETALREADRSKREAETARKAAEDAKDEAINSKAEAEAARAQAEAALLDAEQARTDALTSKEEAERAAEEAQHEKEKSPGRCSRSPSGKRKSQSIRRRSPIGKRKGKSQSLKWKRKEPKPLKNGLQKR